MTKYIGLPRKIKVGGRLYSVKMEPGLKVDGTQCYGVHRPVVQELAFDPESDRDALGHVLHELLHAINNQVNPELSFKAEELLVLKTSHALAALFMDNPDLMKWFTKRAKAAA